MQTQPFHATLRMYGALLLPPLLLLAALFLGLWYGAVHAGPALPDAHHSQERIALSKGPDDEDENDVEGLLLSAPVTGSLGLWVIQSEWNITLTLVSDANTRFDKGVPAAGSWVKARYIVQGDGTLLATRLRPNDYEAGEVVVRLTTTAISATVAGRYDLTPRLTLLSSGHIYLFATLDDDDDINALTAQLQSDPDVVWAEPNYIGGVPEGNPYKVWHWGGADATGYTNQAAFQQVNLAAGLAYARGTGIIVAVLDTGIDLGHPAFAGRLLAGWDMVADDAIPQDEGNGLGWGHGTHVAGVIAAVAPESQIMPVRVLDTNGLGNTFTLAYAIEWAVQQGAHVINLSLGAEADSHVLRTAVEYALGQGVAVVAAAGNNGGNVRHYPVAYPGVIGVTAVDGANRKADFANYGAEWVDLAAPGVGITSTMIGPQGSGYASWSGSSMATAFVSGAAALAYQRLPTASVTATLDLLWRHGSDLDAANPLYAGQIGRLIDIGAALSQAVPPPTPGVTSTPSPSPSPTSSPSPQPTPTPTVVETPSGSGQQPRQYLPFVTR